MVSRVALFDRLFACGLFLPQIPSIYCHSLCLSRAYNNPFAFPCPYRTFFPHLSPPMGFFDHLQKGGAFSLQPQKTQVRKVVQTRPALPKSKSASQTPDNRSPRVQSSSERSRKASTLKSRSASTDPDSRPSKHLNTPSRGRKRPTPEQRLSSDDDASDSDASFEVRKRAKTSVSAEPDPERRLRSVKAFSEEGSRPFKMVHAADITSGQKSGKFKAAFGAEGRTKPIFLQYPSTSQKEKYVSANMSCWFQPRC